MKVKKILAMSRGSAFAGRVDWSNERRWRGLVSYRWESILQDWLHVQPKSLQQGQSLDSRTLCKSLVGISRKSWRTKGGGVIVG